MQSDLEKTEESDLFSLEVIIAIFRRHWLWILLAAILGSIAAFYAAARMGYTFDKTARVILRDDKQKTPQASDLILSELGVSSGGANVANESYVIKSTEVMRTVVNELKLNISYWTKRDIRQIDIYRDTPITVEFPEIMETPGKDRILTITPKDEASYILSYEDTEGKLVSQAGLFHQALTLPFATVLVRPTSSLTDESFDQLVIVTRKSPADTTTDYLKNLSVTRPDSKEASLIELNLKTSNPHKSEDALNRLVEIYNRLSKKEKTLAAQKTETFIKERIIELGGDLGKVDNQISDFQKNNAIVKDLDTTLSANFEVSQEIDKNIRDVKTQIKVVETLKASLTEKDGERQTLPVITGITDQSIVTQIERYNEDYQKYRKLSSSAGEKNPLVKSLLENMDTTLASISRSVKNYEHSLELQLRELESKKTELEERLAQTATKVKEMAPLERQQKVLDGLYLMLLSKREENALALATAEPSARILEAAFGEDKPSAPRTKVFIAAGFMGGGTLCVLCFLLAASLDTKAKTKHDLEEITDIPVLAELPPMNRKEKKSGKLIVQEDRSVLSECFQILRNNVDSLIPKTDDLGQVIMLTSTMAGEGKTMTSSNLAVAFGTAGRKVLLMDGDLRKISLTKRLGAKGRKGSTHVLLHPDENITDVIRPLEGYKNVDVLYAGHIPPNPIVLLTQPRFGEILSELKAKYDKIIIDAPPYGILADTAIIAEHADIVLYLVRSGMIDKRFFTNVQKLHDSGKLKNLAFVMNDVDFKRSNYRYYGYGYGYGSRYGQYANKEQS